MISPTLPSPQAEEVQRPSPPFRGYGSVQTAKKTDREVATPTSINAVPLPRPVARAEKHSAPAASELAARIGESSIQAWARDGQWQQKISFDLDLHDTRLEPREANNRIRGMFRWQRSVTRLSLKNRISLNEG